MADQKSENGKLRRQVARLQREVDRLEFVGLVDVGDDAIEVAQAKPKQKVCRVCGTDTLKEMTTPGGKKIISCTNCLTRQTT